VLREYVSLEKVRHLSVQDDVGEHSREWTDLVRRAMKRDGDLSEADLERIAQHCCECPECDVLYRHRHASVFIRLDAVSATVRVGIGDFAWSRTVQATPRLVAHRLVLTAGEPSLEARARILRTRQAVGDFRQAAKGSRGPR
jgi:hypothetical protein